MMKVFIKKGEELLEVLAVDAVEWIRDHGYELVKDKLSAEVLKFFDGNTDHKSELAKAIAKVVDLEAKLADSVAVIKDLEAKLAAAKK